VPDRPLMFGVPVDPLTMEQTVDRCVQLVESKRTVQHVVLNAGKIVLMRDQPALARMIASCPLVNADGMSIVWAGRLLGVNFPERVTGIDLMAHLLIRAEERGWPVYFFGAKQDILERFYDVVENRFPSLKIAGMRNGYFDDAGAVADDIRESGARILLVALPSPAKENFIGNQLDRLGPVFAMGVGGSFDVWAGHAERAPVWMQNAGLEGFYRFFQEPRKMWRRVFLGNAQFLGLLIKEFFHRTPAVLPEASVAGQE
jgi:N-acetylglucosaminyldiphosphoundecaprenol N-acetyl-beta-D-mannosaminyltransferase